MTHAPAHVAHPSFFTRLDTFAHGAAAFCVSATAKVQRAVLFAQHVWARPSAHPLLLGALGALAVVLALSVVMPALRALLVLAAAGVLAFLIFG